MYRVNGIECDTTEEALKLQEAQRISKVSVEVLEKYAKSNSVSTMTCCQTQRYALGTTRQVKRIMVDLETLDTLPTAMIISIGAVSFDPDLSEATDHTFYRKVDARSSSGTIGADTVLWWMKQSDEARAELCGDGVHINVTLLAFADFCAALNEVWAGPAYFDIPILENAYRRASLTIPWDFRQVRCWSTFKKLVSIDKPLNRCEHNALADAQAQVAGFRQAWARLRGGAS